MSQLAHVETALLVISPGIALFVSGQAYGMWRYARDKRMSRRATQTWIVGLAWILLAGSVYLTILVLDGRANPVGMLGVPFLVVFGVFQVYLARHIEFPAVEEP